MVKPYRSYAEQVQILQDRGMDVGSVEDAALLLRQVNYYRLSGYWYPFRAATATGRADEFVPGTRLVDVWALHQFDVALRAATFGALARVEGYLRARLAHELGALDPCAHLHPELLGPEARGPRGERDYERWLAKYHRSVAESREDFVQHHRTTKDGVLPI